MATGDQQLARLLLESGRLARPVLEEAVCAAAGRPGGLAALLVEHGLVPADELQQVFLPLLAPASAPAGPQGPTAWPAGDRERARWVARPRFSPYFRLR